jgi:hypothetical protein
LNVITLILRIAAFVLFMIAAFGVAAARFNLVAGGLACWVLADVLDGNLSGVGD